ncbi:MAG TPA: UTP--glucose-1-phosphate uridylyltransferase [Planctomycetota bacterium]|nr:UTP--glucose-1-phosphate uridylyltransferase [Planctomycetota bacterium]
MICNAIIPVAGLGTRLLPLTKSQPKELLAAGRKPVIQHIVEELAEAGIKNVLFVTGRRKTAVENHFDRDPELIDLLEKAGKGKLVPSIDFEAMGLSFYYTRQFQQLGLGHAIGCGRAFANGNPFVVSLGDSIIHSLQWRNIVKELVETFESTGAACVTAFEQVPREHVTRYGIAKPGSDDEVFPLLDVIEKPSIEAAPSDLAIAGRYVFSPEIFSAIAETKPGNGGEIQLTDAIRILMARGRKVYGVRMKPGETRHDIGSFESYFKAFLDFAIDDPDYGKEFREYIREVLKRQDDGMMR